MVSPNLVNSSSHQAKNRGVTPASSTQTTRSLHLQILSAAFQQTQDPQLLSSCPAPSLALHSLRLFASLFCRLLFVCLPLLEEELYECQDLAVFFTEALQESAAVPGT